MAVDKIPDADREPEAGQTEAEQRPRRKYSPPKILSAEPLEAAAATCDPPVPPFGKMVPGPCTQSGS